MAQDGETDDAFLGGRLALLQPARGFRAGIDAVLLAAAAPDIGPARVLDAGAGVGTAGLCLASRVGAVDVTLVEREPRLAGMARRNVDRNGLAGRVRVVAADLTASPAELLAAGLAPEMFALLLANPPWHVAGTGRLPHNDIAAAANVMAQGALEAWLRTLARLAAPGATLVLIHRVEVLTRLLGGLDRRFGAIELWPLHSRAGAPARRLLVRAEKGSRAPLVLHAGLVVHAADGGFTPRVDDVLRNGAGLTWPARS